ncbi:hypothetical protein GCM10023195_84630 [Actinoallomurus liliacearum]|uniref:Uncharacterized protein n=1 Tax=Actinoallomurus liliacearum TaxID=1080073 RepID=A0ABP8U0H8_9ACTN
MSEPPAWLRSALREEADAHRPDGDRMWSRVDAGTRGRRARPARGRSLAAAALAAVGVAAVSVGVVTWRAAGPAAPAVPAGHGTAQTDRPAPSSAASTWGSAAPTARSDRPSPTGGPATSSSVPQRPRTTSPAVVAGLASASNAYWAEEDVTLSRTRPLTALRVTVRVTRTAGVRSTGSWSNLPGDTFQVTVGDEGSAVVYTWVLRPGRSVPPGRYVFAAQYARAPDGHDAHQDTYSVTAADGAGRPLTESGRF